MIYIGLDLGEKTLGIARSDSGVLATPVTTFRFYKDHYEDAKNYIVSYIKNEQVDLVVLGYPKNMDDTIGVRGLISEQFKVSIQSETPVEVILWDERLSTFDVLERLKELGYNKEKQKSKKDELAAVIILQSYLDRKGA